MAKAKVVCFINYKGGVGKTTSTYHIGCALAGLHKKRVLFVDIDPQTNLTFLCSPVEKWSAFKSKTGTIATVYKRYLDRKALDVKRFIWQAPVQVLGKYRIEHLDLLPCDIDLIGEDLASGSVTGSFPTMEALKKSSKEFVRERSFLSNVVREIEDDYDFVLIDCPPNLYLMTQNALAASDWYVVTAIPDHLSTIGLNILRQKVDNKLGNLLKGGSLASGTETPLAVAKLGGVIFVKVRVGGTLTTVAHQTKMNEIRSMPGTNCFNTHTTELIGYSEAAENCVPVWAHVSGNAQRAAKKNEYQSITKEFLQRFQ